MPSVPDAEVLEQLRDADWESLVERMIAYAVRLRSNHYYWRQGGELPQGREMEDIVYTVVKKAFSGERTWNPSKVPLEAWLFQTVRSEMNNLFRASATEKEASKVDSEGEELLDTVDLGEDNEQLFEVSAPAPEEALLEQEGQQHLQRMIDAVYEAAQDDPILEAICDEIMATGERKPRLLAKALDLPKPEVNNALKRLDRLVRRVATEMEKSDAQQ